MLRTSRRSIRRWAAASWRRCQRKRQRVPITLRGHRPGALIRQELRMKIDSNSSGLDHAALQRLEKPAADAAKPAAAGKTVSGDAELANEAVKAVNELPDPDGPGRAHACPAGGRGARERRGALGRQPDRQHAGQDERHGQEVTTENRSAFVRLELALREVGEALSRAESRATAFDGARAGRRVGGGVRVRPATIDAGPPNASTPGGVAATSGTRSR